MVLGRSPGGVKKGNSLGNKSIMAANYVSGPSFVCACIQTERGVVKSS